MPDEFRSFFAGEAGLLGACSPCSDTLLEGDHNTKAEVAAAIAGTVAVPVGGADVPLGVVERAAPHHPRGLRLQVFTTSFGSYG